MSFKFQTIFTEIKLSRRETGVVGAVAACWRVRAVGLRSGPRVEHGATSHRHYCNETMCGHICVYYLHCNFLNVKQINWSQPRTHLFSFTGFHGSFLLSATGFERSKGQFAILQNYSRTNDGHYIYVIYMYNIYINIFRSAACECSAAGHLFLPHLNRQIYLIPSSIGCAICPIRLPVMFCNYCKTMC